MTQIEDRWEKVGSGDLFTICKSQRENENERKKRRREKPVLSLTHSERQASAAASNWIPLEYIVTLESWGGGRTDSQVSQ